MLTTGMGIELGSELLDSTRLLFDLQRSNKLCQRLSGCLEPEEIARRVVEGLVEEFGCTFARIWLVETDRTALRLVASAGMYTRLDGFFSRVPLGAFKVGKIAQNGIPFLSNQLAEEPWVYDRNWAIANRICGFAGLPLAVEGNVLGVLAVFSRKPIEPEFLEVLRLLCTSVTVALNNARLYCQQVQQAASSSAKAPLSEQLSSLLCSLTLVGTERPLTTAISTTLLQTAEIFKANGCSYCRLTYGAQQLLLEAILSPSLPSGMTLLNWSAAMFEDVAFAVSCLGGDLQTDTEANRIVQVRLTVPYPSCSLEERLQIDCQQPVLQTAFTRIAYSTGLTVCPTADADVPLLTNKIERVSTAKAVLWLATDTRPTPQTVQAKLDLSVAPQQLREAVAAVVRGDTWGTSEQKDMPPLSEREQEIMSLLARGMRDREIAKRLIISESTVKFHINNSLTKLNAKNRYQAVYQAAICGWI